MKNKFYVALCVVTMFVSGYSFASEQSRMQADNPLDFLACFAIQKEECEQLSMIIDGVQVSFYTPAAKSKFFAIRSEGDAKRQQIIDQYEQDNDQECLAAPARRLKCRKPLK